MKEIKDRVLRTEKIDWRSLKPFQPENLKTMTAESFEKLKKNIIKRNFLSTFDVWKDGDDYWILDGHHRKYALEALASDGYSIPKTLSCDVIDCKDKAEATDLLLSYASSHARLDPEGVHEFISINDLDWDDLKATLDLPGIDFDRLRDENIETLEPEEADDKLPELSVEATTKPGDIWELGEHRLMCGDSTNPQHVDLLLGSRKPNLMVTDPPYGVNYDPAWRDKANLGAGERATGKVKNDDLADWADTYSLFTGNVAYVWHAGLFTHLVAKNLIDCDFDIVSQIIWAKPNFAISRGDYHWKHEPCWYAVKRGETHNWQGARDQPTVWEIKNANFKSTETDEKKVGHGTQKPVECMLRPIINNSKAGEFVYDPFGGSGTTLIACEKSRRKCLMMELDPRYCDMIIKRWQEHAHKQALHLETNKLFDELTSLA